MKNRLALSLVLASFATACGGPTSLPTHQGMNPPDRAPDASTAPGCHVPPTLGPRQASGPVPALRSGAEISLEIQEGERARAKVWDAANPRAGILFVSGVDGGFEQPSDGIYERMAAHYAQLGVSSIFVEYRHPGQLEPSVIDALMASKYLKDQGIRRLLVAGWSFGGAVAIHTAARLHGDAVSVIGFAPQSLDTEAIADFCPSLSILIVHSRTDENVPFYAADQILSEAPDAVRKELLPLDGYNHHLEGTGSVIDRPVFEWVDRELQVQ